MRKLSVFLSAISVFIGVSFASTSILTPHYTINGDDVSIMWTDNSRGGYMDINLQDPQTNDWLHFGEVKMSDQKFTYTMQRPGEQKIQIIPGDGGDIIEFTANNNSTSAITTSNTQNNEKATTVTRTVIPAVPKTGPSGSLIGIIIATLAIFGGYIYIKKRAAI